MREVTFRDILNAIDTVCGVCVENIVHVDGEYDSDLAALVCERCPVQKTFEKQWDCFHKEDA